MRRQFDSVRFEQALGELDSIDRELKELVHSYRFGILPLHHLQDARLEICSVFAKLRRADEYEPQNLEQQLRKAYESIKTVAQKSGDSQIREFAPGAESAIIDIIMDVIYYPPGPSERKALQFAHS